MIKIFGLLGFLTIATAQAADPAGVYEARCSSRGIADAGYELLITKNDPVKSPRSKSVYTARLSEISFFGSRPVAELRVVRADDEDTKSRTYIGSELELSIDFNQLAAPVEQNIFVGKLSGALIHHPSFGEVTCHVAELNVVKPNPIFPKPGMITCMAYWTGAYFDSSTGTCVERGTSGCSNPFEFLDARSCEQAFETRRFR